MSDNFRRGKSGDDLEFMTVPAADDTDAMDYSNRNGAYHNGYEPELQNSSALGCLSYFSSSKHPISALFHLLFKAAALFFYVFASWFTESFIFTFVLCIILLAFDFWTVKNISGRLLVGLRWWSYVKPDGTNEWIFESLEDMAEISAFDSRLFWWGLYLTPVLWVLLLVLGVLRLKFEYIPIILAAIAMSMANIIGYTKCSRDADAKMKNMVASGIKSGTGLLARVGLDQNSTLNWVFNSMVNVGGDNNSPREGSAKV